MSQRAPEWQDSPPLAGVTPDRLFWLGILLAVLAYSLTLRGDFIYDDLYLILMNPNLDSWSQWTHAFTEHVWAFKQPPVAPRHYRPFFVLWLLLNKQLFGGVAPWWHLMSVLLHLFATTLVYRLGLRLLKDEWSAALAAVLFALHPVHIESVAWLSSATDLLATVFLLAAMIAYLRFRERGSAATLVISLLLAAAAILCKETAAIFPILIFLYEWLSDPRPPPRTWFTRALPFAAVVLLYMAATRIAIPVRAISAADADRWTIVTSLPLVAGGYLKTLVFPFQLSLFYAPEAMSHWTAGGAAAVLVLVAVLLGLGWWVRSSPAARFPLAWLLAFSAPPLAAIFLFTRDNWVHDRHMYLPSVGFCLLVALLISRLGLRARLVTTAVLIAVLTIALALQLPRFDNELTLYTHAIRRAPHNLELRLTYAYALTMYGQHERAIQEYEEIARFAPYSEDVFANLGMDYDDQGRLPEARDALARAVVLARRGSSLRTLVLFRLGAVESKLGELDSAERHLREAIALDPDGWNFHAALGEVLRRQGREAEAAVQSKYEEEARRRQISRRRQASLGADDK